MSVLAWNCRGMGNPRTVQRLCKWSQKYSPNILFISETKIESRIVEDLRGRLGFHGAFGVSSNGRSGGLCVFWREKVDFKLISYSQHDICGDIWSEGKVLWRFVGIYGWARIEEKPNTWKLMRQLREDDVPILFGGDFNELLSYDEREGGAQGERRELENFRVALSDCMLRDLGYRGTWYTWEWGNSPSTRVRERLDRFLGSSLWCSMFKEVTVDHLLRVNSDHAPILLHYNNNSKKKKRRKMKDFKFETYWLTEEGCEETIEGAWEGAAGLDVVGKVMMVGRRLLRWREESSENLGKQINATEEALQMAQEKPICVESCLECAEIEKKVIGRVPTTVSQATNTMLLRPYSREEVHTALKHMHPSKAPGPDGMHAIFYQRFWHIVGNDVADFVIGILNGNAILERINKTNIALVSKVKEPQHAVDFRPISLCNVIYKLITKCIVLRLKEVLRNIISENQSAFVPGRLITDNALIALECFHTMKKRRKGRKGHMAMKLDMSKAYDRVEWGFLRQLLLKVGFDGRWVNLSRAATGDIHGIKPCRRGPEISHLLFADDSLLFTRANRRECSNIVDILNQYEAASGQKINYEKSNVPFSKGVETEKKEEMIGILKMKQVERHGQYLGIPNIAGRSKRGVFEALLNRVWKKLQGWKEKLLSQAGKEILLKSVIQAIPTYLMGVYKFPAEVIRKIHVAMANFWWGKSVDRKRIHWKSRDSMCTLKCLGGMGFRDLAIFNDSLLGRQAWRIISQSNSLLSRVMRAKYYRHSDFLGSFLGYGGSFSWRSIWGSKSLIKEGMLWRVGNGECIQIWEDPWICDEVGRFATSTPSEDLTKVSELINTEAMAWDYDKIQANFNDRDKKCILSIPLSLRCPPDKLIWAFSKDGEYTVKTSYMLGKGCNLDDFHQAWVDIWKAQIIPKARNFLWRFCTGTIPIRMLLKHRHLAENDWCPWCENESKTWQHTFFDCKRIQGLWNRLGCEEMKKEAANLTPCDLIESWGNLPKDIKVRGIYLMWGIWQERNMKIFQGKDGSTDLLEARVLRWAEESKSLEEKLNKVGMPIPCLSSRSWLPPPHDFVKINTDASITNEGWVGLGVVARNDEGSVLFAASRRIRAWWSVEIAEAKAIVWALSLGVKFGITNAIIESDCQVIVTRLSKEMVHNTDLDMVLGDAMMQGARYSSLQWSHVRREENVVAHNLANFIPLDLEQTWVNCVPPTISPYVTMDALAF
ncbi:uncharacterized protein LOC110698909 [Chenopodium quinoa]|uniref:uncharacterized protein LOC110698909 n=1 Tax=Chenopodium quinoa TaxID=63459 RepID=UPI000B788DD5|nr:uncharacterized protein LOC110698909 [Chenopodium quinoa]